MAGGGKRMAWDMMRRANSYFTGLRYSWEDTAAVKGLVGRSTAGYVRRTCGTGWQMHDLWICPFMVPVARS